MQQQNKNTQGMFAKAAKNKYLIKLCSCCYYVLIVLLIFFSVQLLFLPNFFDTLLNQGIKNSLIYKYPKPWNENYRKWETEEGVPVWIEVRFFNVTNYDRILYGEYPQLELIGPLVYDEHNIKLNVSFSNDSTKVSYKTYTYYTFNEKKSKISKNDTIIVISPLIGTLYHWYLSKYYDIIKKEEWDFLFNLLSNDLELQKKLLFFEAGAEDLLFNLNLTIFVPELNKTFVIPTSGLVGNQTDPSQAVAETIYTGVDDSSKMGEVYSYDNSQFITCYYEDFAISPGHDDFYGVLTLNKNENDDADEILAWVYDFSRNVILEKNKTVHLNKIELYRYEIQASPQFDNEIEYPPNKMYYQKGPPGVLNITSCNGNVPTFISLPYFLGAPDFASNNSKLNLPPPSINDNMYIDVEPLTGGIFRANKTTQINFPIHSLPLNTFINNNTVNQSLAYLLDLLIPIIGIYECEQLSNSDLNSFYLQISFIKGIKITCYVFGYLSISILIIMTTYYSYLFGQKRQRRINEAKVNS